MLAPPMPSLWPSRLRTLFCLFCLMGVSLPACNCPVLPLFGARSQRPNSHSNSRPNEAPKVYVEGVQPAYRDAWDAVESEIARDPSSPQIIERADALLALSPPLELQVGALTAKAQQAYRVGEDFLAIQWSDDALARLKADPQSGISDALRRDLHRVQLQALARGGNPQRALDRLDALEGSSTFSPSENYGLEAIALQRSEKIPAAALAFLEWRALIPDNADAAYAEARFAALSAQLDPKVRRQLRGQAESPLAKACLSVLVGDDAPADAPPWVLRCRSLPARVGLLLPRSGRYSVFADSHFAAASAAIRVLAQERSVSVVFRDSTSTPAGARKAALDLRREGAEVIVGPVARSQIAAVAKALDGGTRIVVPGEPAQSVDAVAPSLRQRLRALLNYARNQKRSKVVVMAPSNGYGARVKAALAKLRAPALVSQISYPPDTTSFHPFLESARGYLRSNAALIIADSFPRAEMIVRQLRRDDLAPGEGGPAVLLTAEGWSPDQIRGSHAVFDQTILAPVAAASAGSKAFEREFARQQGKEPGVQALLLWEALLRVWRSKGQGRAPRVRLFKVVDEQIQRL